MQAKTFFLGLFIIVLGIFIYLKVETMGDENSSFNTSTRYSLGKYPIVRFLFGLHNHGDARSDFLVGSRGIIVEVVQPEGLPLEDPTIDKFAAKISEYTGKPTKIYNMDTIEGGPKTAVDLAEIVKNFRRHLDAGYVNLFVMYVDSYENSGKEVGKTYAEYGMVLSHDKLVELTKYYPMALPQYQLSTMLHEFGHQVGLNHNDHGDCIMNASVESPDHAVGLGGTNTPVNFCQFELDQLKAIQSGN